MAQRRSGIDATVLRSIARVAVGSSNPVKVGAVRAVIAPLAPDVVVEAVAAESGVPAQPWGDEETIRGATTRALAALEALGADLGVGIEGGVVENADGSLRTCAWAVVVDGRGTTGIGGSLAMPLPPAVAQAIRDGAELGHAMDALTGEVGTKRGAGAVGILTAGLVDRQRAYEVLVTYALAPFLTPELWGGREGIATAPRGAAGEAAAAGELVRESPTSSRPEGSLSSSRPEESSASRLPEGSSASTRPEGPSASSRPER